MRNHSTRQQQSGVVLFVALMLLLILSMIGVTVARLQTVEERMARNEDSRQLAMQGAEAGLRSAEFFLLNAPAVGFFANDTAGLYVVSPTTGSMIPALDMSVAANVKAYNGPALAAPTQPPRIAIEVIGFGAVPGDTLSAPPPTYRITSQGLNADGTPGVTLQSVYR
ncbi:MAG TPA: PilX N-terminal domain-containing pilus assembly protein [Steroidobacteraceae bacterium]|jgi:type IV pilus assembly protein PilX